MSLGQRQLDVLLAEGLAYHKDDGEYYVEREEQAILTLIEKPDLWVCDFCGEQPVEWSYRAKDHAMGAVRADRGDTNLDIHISLGEWMACHICANLIEQQAWVALLQRGVQGFARNQLQDVEMNDEKEIMLTAMIGSVQEGFIKARTGERERI